MKVSEIILKKKAGQVLTADEIDFIIKNYVAGTVPDYQVSALLMAICFKSMNDAETAQLTKTMMNSGEVIDLSAIEGVKVDKHSTGGVGDKTSLVLGPLVASCGVKVAKMSGRGLGHTGGTLDKLESIPGFKIELAPEQFIQQVTDISLAIIGQSGNLVPADKKLYALRDVTGTVESVPLIASSIMSKKLATGADAILLDVKCGNGAFMKTIAEAKHLAQAMCGIGRELKRDTRAIITDMDQPLGKAIGNTCEVIEAIETLRGHGPHDLVELCLEAGAMMLLQAGVTQDHDQAVALLQEKINNGEAFNKLRQMVIAQGGDVSYIDDTSKFPVAKYHYPVTATKSGYLHSVVALSLGETAMKMGAGREKKEDCIDMSAGIIIEKKVSEYIKTGDVIAHIYHNKEDQEGKFIDLLRAAFIIVDEPVAPRPLVLAKVEG